MSRRNYCIFLGLIVLLAGALRFWHLGALQQLVFDEVYFPKYGYDHLTGQYYFDVHPPLSKYIIGAGIWLYHLLPWTDTPAIGSAPLEQFPALSWRWVNAMTGTAFCAVAAWFALLFSRSRIFSLIVALLFASEGMLIVESRFGLNNIYIVAFGFCALIFALKALQERRRQRLNLVLCGVFLGLCYSIKWNGLGYSLAIWSLFIFRALLKGLSQDRAHAENSSQILPLRSLPPAWEMPLYLVIIPFAVYWIQWQPYLHQFPRFDFVEMHKQMYAYHTHSVTADEHPYCSRWYSWTIMYRPISYFYTGDANPGSAEKIVIDVHLFSNPILLWLSTASIVVVSGIWLRKVWQFLKTHRYESSLMTLGLLVIGYFSNLLPWAMVSRCLFLYHYLPAALFSFLAFAWLCWQGLISHNKIWKSLSYLCLAAIAFGFIYWLPFQLGLQLSTQGFYARMWSWSWI